MGLLSLEHSRVAYGADFALYGVAVAGLAAFLVMEAPPAEWLGLCAFVVGGLAVWTLIEYAMHRFLMHGMQPTRRWHARHHRRTTALIGSPTIASALLAFGFVFLPVLAATDRRHAAAATLGVIAGYLAYGSTHHAIHHWDADNAWLSERKRWHALHHRLGRPVCYGVTSSFWDHVFGSTVPNPASQPGESDGQSQ